MRSRILHIDDDPMMLKIVASVLSADPTLETRGYLTGEEGVRAAASWIPDLILSDVSMPGLSGVDVLERLRSDLATMSIPVVFTTACGRQERAAVYMTCGVSGVIPKPFDLRKLAGLVHSYLDQAAAELDAAPMPPSVDIAKRLEDDAAVLKKLRDELMFGGESTELHRVVHKLAGIAGIYGFTAISDAASSLERELEITDPYPLSSAAALAGLDELLDLLDLENGAQSN